MFNYSTKKVSQVLLEEKMCIRDRAKDVFSNKLMSIRFAHGDETTRKIEIEYEL